MIHPPQRAASAARQLLPAFSLAILLATPCTPVLADTFDTSTRSATPAELAQFNGWYAKAHPGLRPPVPVLQLRRVEGKADWRVWGAVAETPARRGIRALCIINRTRFTFDTSWQIEGEARQYAWLESKGCTAQDSAVAVIRRLPESDIVELLEQQGKLLASARLLFAGNTSCARQRALRYQLMAIDLGNIVPGGEEMAALVYHDDRGGQASVWARRSGTEHTAWNVGCAPLLSTVAPQVVRPAKTR